MIHESETLDGLSSENDFKQQFYANNVESIQSYDEPNAQFDNLKTLWWCVYAFISIFFVSILACTLWKCKDLFKKFFHKNSNKENKTVLNEAETSASASATNNIEMVLRTSDSTKTDSETKPSSKIVNKLKYKTYRANVSKIPEGYL